MEIFELTEPERVVRELGRIAFLDVTDYLAVRDGQLEVMDTEDLPEGAGAAVACVERGTGGVKLKFYDKLKALELLGKHFGLFDGTAGQIPRAGVLEALLEATREEVQTHEVHEIQQASAAGPDLVEQAGPCPQGRPDL